MNTSSTEGSVLKILRSDECAMLVQDLVFEGSSVDLRDGFVHLSTAAQAPETAAKHFSGERGLWLARISVCALGESLRWEPSRGGDLFPHLYRALRAEDVAAIHPLPLGPDGRHAFPPEAL